MNKKIKKVSQMVWVVQHVKRGNDIGDKIFETKKSTNEYLRESAYHSNPKIMADVLKNYRVVKAVITYPINSN
jgi:hypothetical protein